MQVALDVVVISKVGGLPVAPSAAAELVLSDDRSLIVHSRGTILARESVRRVVVSRRQVLSTQRVGCSVVMAPLARSHLTSFRHLHLTLRSHNHHATVGARLDRQLIMQISINEDTHSLPTQSQMFAM